MRRRLVLVVLAAAALVLAPGPASAATRGLFVVTTVPTQPGLTFTLDGRSYTTDAQGRFQTQAANQAELNVLRDPYALARRIKLVNGLQADGRRYVVERWYSKSVHSVRTLVAALTLFVPTTFTFENTSGAVFPTRRIGTMVVKRNDGYVATYRGVDLTKSIVLQATRVVPLNAGLVSKEMLYRVQAVTIDGNNLVNRAQQAFLPATNASVKLKLLFYSARFAAQDRLFRFSIGSGIKLEFPNHRVRRYKFDDSGQVVLPALPRGNYRVTINAPGIGLTSPVALTRNQVVKLKVVSYLDVAVVAIVLVGIALSLVLARRPQLRVRLRRALPRWSRIDRAAARTSE